MSAANPLTASSDIQRSFFALKEPTRSKEKTLKPDLGVFADDVVKISQLGIEKQQQETQSEATRKIEDIADEVIKISTTIGRARSVGNLTNSQATQLYNKIANLL